jgi:hypothetical protein
MDQGGKDATSNGGLPAEVAPFRCAVVDGLPAIYLTAS